MENSTPRAERAIMGLGWRNFKISNTSYNMLLGVFSFLSGILMWEVAARYTHRFFLVGPRETLRVFLELLASGELLRHLSLSGQEFFWGFLISVVFGVFLGFSMAMFKSIEAVLDPWVSFFNAVPRLALGPLIILWLGIGIMSKVALVFLGAVFPIIVNTYVGVKTVDQEFKQAAHAFGATQWEEFRTILFPGALPQILAGLRLGSARAILGVLVGEFFGSRGGIGHMIFMSAQMFETGKMLVGVIIFGITGLAFVGLMQYLERWYAPWRQTVGVE